MLKKLSRRRIALAGGIGLLLILACQPSAIHQTSFAPGQPVAPQQDKALKTKPADTSRLKSLVPKSFFAMVGNPPKMTEIADKSKNFHTQDYPYTTDQISDFTATLSWGSAPPAPSSDTVTITSPDLHTFPNSTGYGGSLSVYELGKNAQGQTIATKIGVAFSMSASTANDSDPLFGRSLYFTATVFTSTDGLHYTPAPNAPLSSMGMGYTLKDTDPVRNCGDSLGLNGSVLALSSASLELFPTEGKSILHASFSGTSPLTGIKWSYSAHDASRPDQLSCWFDYIAGNGSADLTMEMQTSYFIDTPPSPSPTPTPSPTASVIVGHIPGRPGGIGGEEVGDRVCKTIVDSEGHQSESCFTCPPGEQIVFKDGKPLACSSQVSTENQQADFGVKRVYDQIMGKNGACVEQ